MTPSPRQLLGKARVHTFEYVPYLASYIYALREQETPGIGTAAVDSQGTLYWCPEYIAKADVGQAAYLITHEVLHLLFDHHRRAVEMLGEHMTETERYICNIAADLIIEQTLSAMRHIRPAGAVYLGAFVQRLGIRLDFPANQSMQEYYRLITEKLRGGRNDGTQDKRGERSSVDGPTASVGDKPGHDGDGNEDRTDGAASAFGDHGQSSSGHSTDTQNERGRGSLSDANRTLNGESKGPGGEQQAPGTGGPSGPDGGDDADEQDGAGSGVSGYGQSRSGDSDHSRHGRSRDPVRDQDGPLQGASHTVGTPPESDPSCARKETNEIAQLPGEPGAGGSCADGQRRPYEVESDGSWDAYGCDMAAAHAAEAIAKAEQSNPGCVPGEIKRAIKQRLNPQPDPFDQLRSAVCTSVASPVGGRDFSHRRRSRKQPMGDDQPLLHGRITVQPHAVVIVDTSSSMMRADLQAKALSVIAQGLRKLSRVRVYCADTNLRSNKWVATTRMFEWHGGGGTDMEQAIREIEEHERPDSIVMVTDAETVWCQGWKPKARVVMAYTGEVGSRWHQAIPKWARVVPLAQEGV